MKSCKSKNKNSRLREDFCLLEVLKNQMQTLMLASSNDSYVFKIIDPPIISEEKTKPSRALISILGTFLGGFFAVLIILIQYFRNPSEH